MKQLNSFSPCIFFLCIAMLGIITACSNNSSNEQQFLEMYYTVTEEKTTQMPTPGEEQISVYEEAILSLTKEYETYATDTCIENMIASRTITALLEAAKETNCILTVSKIDIQEISSQKETPLYEYTVTLSAVFAPQEKKTLILSGRLQTEDGKVSNFLPDLSDTYRLTQQLQELHTE